MKKLVYAIIVLSLTLIPCIAFACECECNCFDCTCYSDEICVSTITLRTTGKVNVRQWADIDSPSVDTIGSGELIEVDSFYPTDDGRIWAELRNDYGYVYGYVSMKYLEYAEKTNLPELAQYMLVTGASVNARKDANINAGINSTVHRGDVVEAEYYTHTSDGRIWAASYLDGEYIGFISCRYLTPAY